MQHELFDFPKAEKTTGTTSAPPKLEVLQKPPHPNAKNEPLQDFYGNWLEVGDMVATTLSGYSQLHALEVVGFTLKMITLKRVTYITRAGQREARESYLHKLPNQVSLIAPPHDS